MKRRYTLLLLSTLLLGTACGDGTEITAPVTPVGTYDATTFTISGPVQGDILASGGSMTITLMADGTTTGSLFIPGSLAGGTDLNADMAGTWSLAGSTVTFQQTADTFVRDANFSFMGRTLQATETFGTQTVTLVLSLPPVAVGRSHTPRRAPTPIRPGLSQDR